jgi:septal ring factor EnvC (AmiA/AmiB activator)
MNAKRFGWILVACLWGATALWSQSKPDRTQLERERARLTKEIRETEKRIKEISSQKKKSVAELEELKKKISIREQLIQNISQDVYLLNGQIGDLQKAIMDLERDLSALKKQYSDMLRWAYKNRNSVQNALFVVSASDFNQAYKRYKYLGQYQNYREQQYHEIVATKRLLEQKVLELNGRLNEKSNLLVEESSQKAQLQSESVEKKEMLVTLQEGEKDLREKLQKQVASREKLNRAIESLIRAEIEEARRKAAAANKPAPTSDREALAATPEALKLSSDFASNRGGLPWPVGQGNIVSRYGTHPHPVLDNVQISNNGIDIKTNPGASVKAVFSGTVTAVFNIRGLQNMVIVRHGQYCTVYAHIDQVSVNKGDKVKGGQSLGTVFTDPEDQKTEVHFELWNGFNKMDPEPWLKR